MKHENRWNTKVQDTSEIGSIQTAQQGRLPDSHNHNLTIEIPGSSRDDGREREATRGAAGQNREEKKSRLLALCQSITAAWAPQKTQNLGKQSQNSEAEIGRALRTYRKFGAELSRVRHKHEHALRQFAKSQSRRLSLTDACELAILNEKLAMLESLAPTLADVGCKIILSATMLKESFLYCTQDEREGLHFVTGVEFDGVKIGTAIRTFPYAVQNVVAAEGNLLDTHRIAIEIADAGDCLVGIFHSHPGSGPGSNEPSGTDLRTQRILEKTTRLAAGIWARDGNLRLYGQAASEVQIIGNAMERQDDGTWQLASQSN